MLLHLAMRNACKLRDGTLYYMRVYIVEYPLSKHIIHAANADARNALRPALYRPRRQSARFPRHPSNAQHKSPLRLFRFYLRARVSSVSLDIYATRMPMDIKYSFQLYTI